MFYYFLHVYKEDEAFVCLDINKEGLRTDQLSVFICLKGACLVCISLRMSRKCSGMSNRSRKWTGYSKKECLCFALRDGTNLHTFSKPSICLMLLNISHVHTPAANVVSLLCSSSVERASHVREEGAGGGVPPQSAGAANRGGHLHR